LVRAADDDAVLDAADAARGPGRRGPRRAPRAPRRARLVEPHFLGAGRRPAAASGEVAHARLVVGVVVGVVVVVVVVDAVRAREDEPVAEVEPRARRDEVH